MTNTHPTKRRLRVKETLAEHHMSMAKLSRRGNLTLRTVRNVCHNPYHAARPITLQKIANTLNVPVTDLFEDIPDNNV